jgi:hypothetical protein
MEFYTSTESHGGFDYLHIAESETIANLTKVHPKISFKKPKGFSNLTAEERWNYTKKINALQRLINEIQSSKELKIEKTGFSLEEVLEVLNVRHAMHKH